MIAQENMHSCHVISMLLLDNRQGAHPEAHGSQDTSHCLLLLCRPPSGTALQPVRRRHQASDIRQDPTPCNLAGTYMRERQHCHSCSHCNHVLPFVSNGCCTTGCIGHNDNIPHAGLVSFPLDLPADAYHSCTYQVSSINISEKQS